MPRMRSSFSHTVVDLLFFSPFVLLPCNLLNRLLNRSSEGEESLWSHYWFLRQSVRLQPSVKQMRRSGHLHSSSRRERSRSRNRSRSHTPDDTRLTGERDRLNPLSARTRDQMLRAVRKLLIGVAQLRAAMLEVRNTVNGRLAAEDPPSSLDIVYRDLHILESVLREWYNRGRDHMA